MLKQARKLNEEYLTPKIKDILESIRNEYRLKPEELEARAGSAHAFYKTYFEKVLNLLIFKQITEELGIKGEKAEQILFARGVLRGLQVIEEWFGEQESIAMAKFQPEENIEDVK